MLEPLQKFYTDIIPVRRTYYNTLSGELLKNGSDGRSKDLDYEAIAVFLATGFFLGNRTWLKDISIVPPASEIVHANGQIKQISERWAWSSFDGVRSLADCVEEFAGILENTVKGGGGPRKRILALSGGLDSRTLAAAVFRTGVEAQSYSYSFPNGIPETDYGRAIAGLLDIPFHEYQIRPSYLWSALGEVSRVTNCESDFTHPRQMAVIDEIEGLGEEFLLGHWGDVLFSSFGPRAGGNLADIVTLVESMILKHGGAQLGEAVWRHRGLDGNFREFLRSQIEAILGRIEIRNTSARLRAFKSLTWAPRWTSVGLGIFGRTLPLCVPYYAEPMCRFITTVPEHYLDGRLIQREYLKNYAPSLAKIPWQAYAPYNVYDFERYTSLSAKLARASTSLKRRSKEVLTGKPLVQRNWELQFLGRSNLEKLDASLRDPSLQSLLPSSTIGAYLSSFRSQPGRENAHACSMLLTSSTYLSREL